MKQGLESRDGELQCVGGTHTAQLGSAGPVLAGRLGPVCLNSLRKGQIKGRARGHNTAYRLCEAAAHMYIYAREAQRNREHTCSLGFY